MDGSWNREVIQPLLTQVASVINAKWLPLYGNRDRLVFAFNNPVPEDEEFLLKKNTELVDIGVISRNEARIRMGMKRIDELEMDVPLIPINLRPVTVKK